MSAISLLTSKRASAADEAAVNFANPQLPQHLAVIMDGNRRWARDRRLPALLGHRAGVRAFRRLLERCRELGIPHLTAYAFSAENWRRSPLEVEVLMKLFERYAAREREKLRRTGIRFRLIGDIDELPRRVQEEFLKTVEATAHNRAMTLNLAVNYGAREEILRAVRLLATEAASGGLEPAGITAEMIEQRLYTQGQPDPDLLIRTSGELRMSNFLLWQSAYTEFYFTDAYWPDVDDNILNRALSEFSSRDRRYGGGSVS
jgi:undecaprenyl diphosphate synthase